MEMTTTAIAVLHTDCTLIKLKQPPLPHNNKKCSLGLPENHENITPSYTCIAVIKEGCQVNAHRELLHGTRAPRVHRAPLSMSRSSQRKQTRRNQQTTRGRPRVPDTPNDSGRASEKEKRSISSFRTTAVVRETLSMSDARAHTQSAIYP